MVSGSPLGFFIVSEKVHEFPTNLHVNRRVLRLSGPFNNPISIPPLVNFFPVPSLGCRVNSDYLTSLPLGRKATLSLP